MKQLRHKIRFLVLNSSFALLLFYLFMRKLSVLIFASGLKFHLLTLIFCAILFLPLLCHFLWYIKKMVVQAVEGDWVSGNKLAGSSASTGRQRGSVSGRRAAPFLGQMLRAEARLQRVSRSPLWPENGFRKQQAARQTSAEILAQKHRWHSPAKRIIGRRGGLKLGATFVFQSLRWESRRAAARSCAQRSAAVGRKTQIRD